MSFPRYVAPLIVGLLGVGWVLLVWPNRSAGQSFVDDFQDGSLTDGSPVSWSIYPDPFDRGEIQIESGDAVLTPANSGPTTYPGIANYWELAMIAEQFQARDVTIHAQFRALGEEATSLFALGLRDTVDDDGRAATNIFGLLLLEDNALLRLGLMEGMDAITLQDEYPRVSHFEEDLHLRLTAVGEEVFLSIWSDGDPEPDSPTISYLLPEDRPLSTGRVIMTAGGRNDVVPIAVRFVEVAAIVPGDVNYDGLLDVADVDRLALAIRSQEQATRYDLNQDSRVDTNDLHVWVEELFQTYLGDANLDGEFNSGDLVSVLVQGEYEDDVNGNSGWADGDWNADAEFDSADFVAALSGGGFEQGPRNAVAAVPEPTIPGLPLSAAALAYFRRQFRRRHAR